MLVVTGAAAALGFTALTQLPSGGYSPLPAVAESMSGGIDGITGDRVAMLTAAAAALAATAVAWNAAWGTGATVRSA